MPGPVGHTQTVDGMNKPIATQNASDLASYCPAFEGAVPFVHPHAHLPMVGEKPDPTLTLRVSHSPKGRHHKENTMAVDVKAVPQDITEDQEKRALAKVKETDTKTKGEPVEDLINTGINRNGYTLWHVRKRGGVKDAKTGRKPVTASKLVWMPHAVNSSLDQMISYFALKYGESNPQAGETIFKERALQSEVITQRAKMAPTVKAAGQKRGKFRS
jgi:uncharacterized Zn-finger protein